VLGGVTFVAMFLVSAWGLDAPELAMLTGGLRRRLARRR